MNLLEYYKKEVNFKRQLPFNNRCTINVLELLFRIFYSVSNILMTIVIISLMYRFLLPIKLSESTLFDFFMLLLISIISLAITVYLKHLLETKKYIFCERLFSKNDIEGYEVSKIIDHLKENNLYTLNILEYYINILEIQMTQKITFKSNFFSVPNISAVTCVSFYISLSINKATSIIDLEIVKKLFVSAYYIRGLLVIAVTVIFIYILFFVVDKYTKIFKNEYKAFNDTRSKYLEKQLIDRLEVIRLELIKSNTFA